MLKILRKLSRLFQQRRIRRNVYVRRGKGEGIVGIDFDIESVGKSLVKSVNKYCDLKFRIDSKGSSAGCIKTIQIPMDNFESKFHLSIRNLSNEQTDISETLLSSHVIDVSEDLLAYGTEKRTGALFIYRRNPYSFYLAVPGVIAGPIKLIKISNDQQSIAYANSTGDVALYSLKSLISKSSHVKLLKGAVCTALHWHSSDKQLYCGDSLGNVSVVSSMFFMGRNLMNIQLSQILLLDSSIVQIDGFNDYLLISSLTKTILCNNEREEFKQIGNRPRDGFFGACFSIDYESLENQKSKVAVVDEYEYERMVMKYVTIYCSRPGMRLWQVDLNGNVLKTHQFKNAISANEFVSILGAPEVSPTVSTSLMANKTNQFQLISSLNNDFVFTWNASGFFIIDPSNSKILFWTNDFNGLILSAFTVRNTIYLLLKDGRLLEMNIIKLQFYALHLCNKERYMEAAELIKNHLDYFTDLFRSNNNTSDLNRTFLKIRDYLLLNNQNDFLKILADFFEELEMKKSNIVVKNYEKEHQEEEEEKSDENRKQIIVEKSVEENDMKQINRAVRQLYILHESSLNSKLNYRERLRMILKPFKNLQIIMILNELEKLLLDFHETHVSSRIVSEIFLDYLQPEMIFDIEDEEMLNLIANSLIVVQDQQDKVSRCLECEFPLNCGSSSSGHEEIGNILHQFYWSSCEYEKCFELCQKLPYLLKITGKFITDEKKMIDKMIPYAINLGDLEILHKTLQLFDDITLFYQLIDDYIMACDGKFKCLKCNTVNKVTEVHRSLTWDSLFQAIEFYIYGDELIELLLRFSQFIPNGALSRNFYMKLLIHASE